VALMILYHALFLLIQTYNCKWMHVLDYYFKSVRGCYWYKRYAMVTIPMSLLASDRLVRE